MLQFYDESIVMQMEEGQVPLQMEGQVPLHVQLLVLRLLSWSSWGVAFSAAAVLARAARGDAKLLSWPPLLAMSDL